MQVKDKHRNRRGTVVLAVVCVLLQVMLSPNIGMGNGHVTFASSLPESTPFLWAVVPPL